MSLSKSVTLLAWVVHKYASSNKLTAADSTAYWIAAKASDLNLTILSLRTLSNSYSADLENSSATWRTKI